MKKRARRRNPGVVSFAKKHPVGLGVAAWLVLSYVDAHILTIGVPSVVNPFKLLA